jgi:DNA (cytosine-5)-methyltransferase 1
MKFIDWFAGIGGFRRGLELAGHECVGFCEFDKFANASYRSMHTITDEQREHLATLDLKKRQKEILKEEYLNGEWFAEDVRTVNSADVPRADVWCFGFPCQDISICGKQGGIKQNRSGLFYRIIYLLEQTPEEKRPVFLLIENVKNLLSVNRGWDFARLLSEVDGVGYDAEWKVLNSKDFGVPQNRERVYIVGRFRKRCSSKILCLDFGGEYITK